MGSNVHKQWPPFLGGPARAATAAVVVYFPPTRHRQVPGEMFNINLVHGRAAGLSFRPSVRASIKNVG